MHPNTSPKNRPGLLRVALALMIATTLPLTLARAGSAAATPPDFPDALHVKNGCYISTTAYIAKFLAAFPTERAMPLTVRPSNYEGPHTIALLTWAGHWWARDEYFGVFTLDRNVTAGATAEQMTFAATRALMEHSVSRLRADDINLDEARRKIPARQRAREIASAAALLPLATELLWVRSGREEIPFLFFHPAEGRIAVYDPLTGTTQAECPCTDGRKVVAAVATRIGYHVDSVRRDTDPNPAVLVAANESAHGGLAR